VECRFKTADDLISSADVNPGGVSIGMTGAGSADHLMTAVFAEPIGTQFNFVPYKSSELAQVATAGGQMDVAASGSVDYVSLIRNKKHRP
jgi:tripartite-type tricarboxylate transporter receptor subunit TctC